MKTVLITGANRGLGLALATRCLDQPGTHVIAVTRDLAASPDIHALARAHKGRVQVAQADLGDPASLDAFAKTFDGAAIDLLINNAGVSSFADFANVTAEELGRVFMVNAFAPLLLTQMFHERIVQGGKVVNISSVLGSIESARGSDGNLVYGMSKAALNMFSVQLAHILSKRNIAVLSLHPGWVKTRMGGSGASITVETSADGMMRVIEALDMASTGRYLAYDGSSIPW
jgi:NAD(P)-dependent dehydrogenase (short-subunit alcohol dehydrogenase family)